MLTLAAPAFRQGTRRARGTIVVAVKSETKPRRASLPEIVGAWLHVWTPPRDVEIPPVPWRKLAIGTGIGAVLCAAALAAIVPAIDRGKERRAAHARAQAAAERAAERRRIVREQRPRHGRAAALRAQGGRAALLAHVESAISRDAAARVRAGELRGPVGPTSCQPAADAVSRPERGVFNCLTLVRRIRASAGNAAGALGYPFRAVLDYRTFAYTWCKTNPVPGELVVPDPRTVIELPRACRGL
jgi:hypothetical protein